MESPANILLSYETDKVRYHSYGPVYNKILTNDFRYRAVSVLEIGVHHGQSLRAWRDIFPYAEINGIDIAPECQMTGTRIRTYCDDVNTWNPQWYYNFIVDDGSHNPKDQLNALFRLWPFLRKDGIYVVEDIFPQFLPVWEHMPCELIEGNQALISDNIAIFHKEL